jgi:hypothetical protein
MATGIFTKLAYKKESTWGTLAGASGAQYLRRKTADIGEVAAFYSSAEINTTQKRQSYVKGSRHAEGSLNGELSGGTYTALLGSLVRRDFTAVSAMTGVSLTIAAGSGVTFTITGTGFLTGGIKQGMVIRLTAGALNAANLNKNLFVISSTATVITVQVANGVAMVAEGPISSCTVTIPGKISYVPSTGHTNDSYTFERFFSDTPNMSHVTSGDRIASCDFALPATGYAECTLALLGKGFGQTPSSSQYFSSPTAVTTSGGLTAVTGLVKFGGTLQGAVTSLQFKVNGNMTTVACVGSNYTPDVYAGPIDVDGTIVTQFQDSTMVDAYVAGTAVAINVATFASTAAASDFMCFSLPACIIGNTKPTDGQGSLSISAPFTAIDNTAGGTGTDSEATNIWFQDSLAP